MSLSVKVTSFTWLAADTAGTNYDVTLGFQPEFAVVFAAGVTGSTDSCARGNLRLGMGFIKDGTTRVNVGYASADAGTNAAYASAHATTSVVLSISTTSGIASRLDVDAKANWPSDGIRFTVDTQVSNDRRVSVLAVGGSDITGVAIGSFQEPGATGNQTIAHGLGATPTGVLFASAGVNTAPESALVAGPMCLSIGAYDGTTGWVTTQYGDDAAGTMANVSYAKTSDVIALGAEGITNTALASGVSLDSTNITVNWSKRTSPARYVFYLAWVGGTFDASSTTTATNTTPFNGPTAGFVPKAALFASACRAASSADTPTSHAQLSLGAATGASERVAHAMLDENGTASAEVSTALETDAVYANISASSAIQGLMDVADMTVDPMSLVMDDADPSGSFVGVAIWGASGGAPPSEIVDFSATATSATNVALTWTAATDADNHRVERWED